MLGAIIGDIIGSPYEFHMHKMGPFSSHIVEYGEDKNGKRGYNELHVLDERIQTPNITLILEKEKPITLKKHVFIPNVRGYERD